MTVNARAIREAAIAEKERRRVEEESRASFSAFFAHAFSQMAPVAFEPWFHHEAMCNHLQRAVEDWDRAGREPDYQQLWEDIVVNVGPLSLKSKIFMVGALPWIWLRWPSFFGYFTSGTPSNVDRDSIACRDLVSSAWYRNTFRIPWAIRGDMDKIAKWGTTAGGVRESRGMGSSVTGVHADGIFVDDPDDAAGVHSDAARRDTWLAWEALGNRLNDLRRPMRFIIQQDVHAEDLSQKRLARGGRVVRLCIPLEFKASKRCVTPIYTDPRTEDGEVLQPARFTPAVIAAERIRLGPHGFHSQYNQDPAPLDGGMFKRGWWGFFRIDGAPAATRARPEGCDLTSPTLVLPRRADGNLDLDWLTVSVDATFGSLKDTASRVGLLTVGGKRQRRFVFDDRTRRMTYLDTCAAIKALITRWPARRVIVELKANGAAVVEDLKKALADGTLLGPDGKRVIVVVDGLEANSNYVSRAAAMQPAIAAGLVYLLEGAAWLYKGEDEDDDGFVFELGVFPNGKHDDRVDALSQLMNDYNEADGVARARALAGIGAVLLGAART